jgi:fructokinase
MPDKTPLIAAIEAGGTKFNCAVGSMSGELLGSMERIATTTPEETLRGVLAFFEDAVKQHGPIAAFGVGTVGPLDVHRDSKSYGFITTTPKPGWQNADLLGPLRERFGVPIGFDTDVNAAALGEHTWGAGLNCDPLIYITIGTGIGGGALVNGHLLHGMLHPEMGHLLVTPPHSSAPNPACTCPYHLSCMEGYLCGPAIAKRWGAPAETFPAGHEMWHEFAVTLASGLVNLIVTLSPRRIILGGGVMHQEHLFPMIRAEVLRLLNGYLQTRELIEDIDHYIVPPGLGDRAGIMGSLALGIRALGGG